MSQSQSEFSEILELLVDFVGYVHLLTPLFYYGPGEDNIFYPVLYTYYFIVITRQWELYS